MITTLDTVELVLQRGSEGPTGTASSLSYQLGFISHAIELPWKNNQRKISRVIAGRYPVTRVDSPAHGICLEMQDIPGRGDCQFHKANWALGRDGKHPELQGCIAPVTKPDLLPGIGWGSAAALQKLEDICFPVLDAGGLVFVTILDIPTPEVIAKAVRMSTPNSRIGATGTVTAR